MRLKSRSICLAATAGALICAQSFATTPNAKKSAKRAASQQLQAALQEERKGVTDDRARRLKSVRRTAPDFAPAQWQSGRVNVRGQWVNFDDVVDRVIGHNLTQQYLKLRKRTKLNVKGHLHLAEWCRKHGMADRRRAHLMGVLAFEPDHSFARKALGYVRIGALWIERVELAKRQKDAAVARKHLQYWLPRIGSMRTAILGRDARRRKKALEQLSAVDQPAAADAIELCLGWHSPHLAALAVNRLAKIKHPHTTLSLARLAVASPWKSVRFAATTELKKRKFDHFVPQLLAVARTPVQTRKLLFLRPNGSLFYRHAFYREDRKSKRIAVADYNHYIVNLRRNIRFVDGMFWPNDPNRPPDFRHSQDTFSSVIGARLRIQNDAGRTALESAARRKASVEEENRKTREINGRIRDLLADVAGRKFEDDPREWWGWWDTSSEVWRTRSKPVDYQYRRVDTFQYLETVDVNMSTFSPPVRSNSCLVAGTPVWTERGLVAVEKIRIGDRVLSKNVDTGQLAYKPVVLTTVRPAVGLMKLEIGNRTISLTKGHPFWISGRGWTKARDIERGMFLHNVTGTTAVRPAGDAKPAKTYNLIVADFHTYFVGEAKVLSHDNTPIEPTAALVPGLVRK